jgi:N-methylhydantoinase B/oxoprolinase/acetone carboxylase alpha subunit
MADITITLGDKEFKISPLTIRQSLDLRIGDATVPKDDGTGGWTNTYDACIKTIAVAIREAHPEVTEDELWKIKTTENEIAAARKAILVHAGFRAPEPTIAELRAKVAAMKIELADLEKTLAERESKAKVTGEG